VALVFAVCHDAYEGAKGGEGVRGGTLNLLIGVLVIIVLVIIVLRLL
jgi:hypothetical protein